MLSSSQPSATTLFDFEKLGIPNPVKQNLHITENLVANMTLEQFNEFLVPLLETLSINTSEVKKRWLAAKEAYAIHSPKQKELKPSKNFSEFAKNRNLSSDLSDLMATIEGCVGSLEMLRRYRSVNQFKKFHPYLRALPQGQVIELFQALETENAIQGPIVPELKEIPAKNLDEFWKTYQLDEIYQHIIKDEVDLDLLLDLQDLNTIEVFKNGFNSELRLKINWAIQDECDLRHAYAMTSKPSEESKEPSPEFPSTLPECDPKEVAAYRTFFTTYKIKKSTFSKLVPSLLKQQIPLEQFIKLTEKTLRTFTGDSLGPRTGDSLGPRLELLSAIRKEQAHRAALETMKALHRSEHSNLMEGRTLSILAGYLGYQGTLSPSDVKTMEQDSYETKNIPGGLSIREKKEIEIQLPVKTTEAFFSRYSLSTFIPVNLTPVIRALIDRLHTLTNKDELKKAIRHGAAMQNVNRLPEGDDRVLEKWLKENDLALSEGQLERLQQAIDTEKALSHAEHWREDEKTKAHSQSPSVEQKTSESKTPVTSSPAPTAPVPVTPPPKPTVAVSSSSSSASSSSSSKATLFTPKREILPQERIALNLLEEIDKKNPDQFLTKSLVIIIDELGKMPGKQATVIQFCETVIHLTANLKWLEKACQPGGSLHNPLASIRECAPLLLMLNQAVNASKLPPPVYRK